MFKGIAGGQSPFCNIPEKERRKDMIPSDPVMLLSFINTNLRDNYPSLEELCRSLDADEKKICDSLSAIGYTYDKERNTFR